MKSYHEHITDFIDAEILEGLLGYGLFPNKIPPFLTSKPFYDYVVTNTPVFNTKRNYDYVSYENMRNINVPRLLAIPHPFGYALLCQFIAKEWSKTQNYFKDKTENQTHKVSRVHLRKMIDKHSLFEMNYKNFDDDGFPENDLLIRSNFIAKADISNCYPSIYSHSISWALVGKKEAKLKSKPAFKNEWFNKYDELSRKIKNNETNGILIGPHTSNLISEIVLVAIDLEMENKGYRFTRYIDDYTCYVETYNDAEQFFIDLSIELKKFELSLNHKKSEILTLPFSLAETWLRKLKAFHFPEIVTKEGKHVLKIAELRSFLDLTLDLMKSEKENSAILSYAIKIISSKYLGAHARTFYFKRLHHLILLYPYLLPYVDEYLLQPFNYSKAQIKELLDDILDYSFQKNIPEATSYVLFLALKYDILLDKYYTTEILDREDCMAMLLLYLYTLKQGGGVRVFKTKAEDLSKVEFDKFWLFIYEVLPNTKLKDNFKQMKLDKLSFIDEDFRSKFLVPVRRGCLPAIILPTINNLFGKK
ncbi:RNA-directed DNA polymerase [Psychroserpens damuponensis]|uniref:RNA-directed DNA polymerase n=1 Tax=Psychroserpens damuponensis TaxID=943936 RepID=UPI0006943F67|nr:RNA-directed DNA polymerase [Psychroserpens damuponensis]